jgi:hypothetical protein
VSNPLIESVDQPICFSDAITRWRKLTTTHQISASGIVGNDAQPTSCVHFERERSEQFIINLTVVQVGTHDITPQLLEGSPRTLRVECTSRETPQRSSLAHVLATRSIVVRIVGQQTNTSEERL